MTLCYIGLGSNLSTPLTQLEQACEALTLLPQLTSFSVSSFYGSKPMGPQDQPDYVNAVAQFNWSASSEALLDALQKIELEQGRVRKENRWGPRTLDLDILLFGNEIITTERLTVPHYGMKTREFVLYPLLELAPSLTLPSGESIKQLANNCPLNDLAVIS